MRSKTVEEEPKIVGGLVRYLESLNYIVLSSLFFPLPAAIACLWSESDSGLQSLTGTTKENIIAGSSVLSEPSKT